MNNVSQNRLTLINGQTVQQTRGLVLVRELFDLRQLAACQLDRAHFQPAPSPVINPRLLALSASLWLATPNSHATGT